MKVKIVQSANMQRASRNAYIRQMLKYCCDMVFPDPNKYLEFK